MSAMCNSLCYIPDVSTKNQQGMMMSVRKKNGAQNPKNTTIKLGYLLPRDYGKSILALIQKYHYRICCIVLRLLLLSIIDSKI